jgi:hypothetical protein
MERERECVCDFILEPLYLDKGVKSALTAGQALPSQVRFNALVVVSLGSGWGKTARYSTVCGVTKIR